MEGQTVDGKEECAGPQSLIVQTGYGHRESNEVTRSNSGDLLLEVKDCGDAAEKEGCWDALYRLKGDVVKKLSEPKKKTLKVIMENPGVIIKEVAEIMGFSHTTTTGHLTVLCNKGLVTREKDGNVWRYYPLPASEPRTLSWLKSSVRDPQRYAVVEHLVKKWNANDTLNKIACELGIYHGFLVRAIKSLEKHDLVELVERGSRNYVRPTQDLRDYFERLHETDSTA